MLMESKGFEQLKVWQKAHSLTLKIYQVTRSFPKEEQFGLISQIKRACISVCANIAEGQSKTRKDFLRFLDISLASLQETKYYLILSKDLAILDSEKFRDLIQSTDEVGKMLHGLKKAIKTKISNHS
ncbi:MAG: four helix bundle protein [Candidatus Omnitrophica bacterium]|nr:four helix bundle protein [Candidatus Omnitrophota bacterium]